MIYLSNQLLDHMSMDIGQAVVSTLEAVGQLFVIEAKQVHPCRLKVVNMDWIFGYTKA